MTNELKPRTYRIHFLGDNLRFHQEILSTGELAFFHILAVTE